MNTAEIALCVSAGALLVSLFSTAISARSLSFTRRTALTKALIEPHSASDAMLLARPGLLALHGITPEHLAAEGVTSDEVVYLVGSFEAGATYHRLVGNSRLTEYRKTLLAQKKVRLIWKRFIVGQLISRDAFSEAVDRYIAELEQLEKKPATALVPGVPM